MLCVALAVAQGAAAFSFPALATRRTSLSLRGSPAVNNRRVLASVRGPERRNVGVLALASTEGGAAAVAGYRFVDKRKEALLVLPVGEEVRWSTSSSIAGYRTVTTSSVSVYLSSPSL